MEQEIEDFDNNRFYIFLQNNFRRLYEEAQSRRHTICLPCNNSVLGVRFSLAFIEQHILKPSPFFKGEFHTTNISGEPKVLHIDGATISTGDGFPEKKNVKIIGEETGYNSDYQSYRILLLDKPLVPVSINRSHVERKSPLCDLQKERISAVECRQFLENLPACTNLLTSFRSDVKLFKDTYYVVRGYLDDASAKLQSIYNKYVQELNESVDVEDPRDAKFAHNLHNCVESYILEESYPKVHPVICDQCKVEEKAFIQKLAQIKGLKGSQLGLKPEFIFDMTTCVQYLKEVEGLVTPLEILSKLKEVLDSISTAMVSHTDVLHTASKSDLPRITSDEIIPLLVLVLVQCQPSLFVTNLYYVEHFHWSTSALDNLSFILVSFKAAVLYIQSTDFEQFKSGGQQSTTASGTNIEGVTDSVTEPISSTVRGRQFDRQLNRINKMFQNCAIDNTNQYFPSSIPLNRSRGSQKKAMLGDFLSSLQSDGLNCAYGKQE